MDRNEIIANARRDATTCTLRAMRLQRAAATAPAMFCTVIRDADGVITNAAHEVVPGGYNMMGLDLADVALLSRRDAELFARQYNGKPGSTRYTATVATAKETYEGLAQSARHAGNVLRKAVAKATA
ncbi:hypothetical protein RPALISO_248 [Ruegeria phage RpAliso]|nr:hypothetical protein RPALISO_248 [Ruegeria phage RpAliso]